MPHSPLYGATLRPFLDTPQVALRTPPPPPCDEPHAPSSSPAGVDVRIQLVYRTPFTPSRL
jgi:hypothetical protein